MLTRDSLSFQSARLPMGQPQIPWGNPGTPLAGLAPLSSTWPVAMPNGSNPLHRGQWLMHQNGVDSYRNQMAQHLAARFCEASVNRWGTDEVEVKETLKEVARQGVRQSFQAAVLAHAHQKGLPVKSVEEIIDRELAGNFMLRAFKSAPHKECQDLLRWGRNTHRPTPWEYRRYGMYRSLADFVNLCKKHPVMSFAVIGAVSVLGHLYPFFGATSGIVLMGWAGVMSVVNEIKASNRPRMNDRKAENYTQSGENMAAILMTLPGFHGIKDGTEAGFKAWGNVMEATQSVPKGLASGLWKAISLRNNKADEILAKGGKPSSVDLTEKKQGDPKWLYIIKRGLFVAGLFDNVLLPFNAIADELDDQK